MSKSGEPLPCVFWGDFVPCAFRESMDFSVMARCFRCSHRERFERSMDEEDEKVMAEVDEEFARSEEA